MPRNSAVVVLTRVHVSSPRRARQLRAVAFVTTGGYLHLSGLAPCTLLLLRAASGGPGLLVPPAGSKSKAMRTDVPLMIPLLPFCQVKPHAARTEGGLKQWDTCRRSCSNITNRLSWTKPVVPRVDTAPHGVETSTSLAHCWLDGDREDSATRRG